MIYSIPGANLCVWRVLLGLQCLTILPHTLCEHGFAKWSSTSDVRPPDRIDGGPVAAFEVDVGKDEPGDGYGDGKHGDETDYALRPGREHRVCCSCVLFSCKSVVLPRHTSRSILANVGSGHLQMNSFEEQSGRHMRMCEDISDMRTKEGSSEQS